MSDVLAIIGGGLLTLLTAVISGLVVAEVTGWLPRVSHALVRWALRRVAADHDRWAEEIAADVASLAERPLSGLLHTVRAVLRLRSLAAELPAPTAVATDTATDPATGPKVVLVNVADVSEREFERLRRLDHVAIVDERVVEDVPMSLKDAPESNDGQ